uniref:Uncharacterized protein n=1 Tax=Anopheles culicifacies TaxID=139723 RepID=A0A182LZW7_9DIPT
MAMIGLIPLKGCRIRSSHTLDSLGRVPPDRSAIGDCDGARPACEPKRKGVRRRRRRRAIGTPMRREGTFGAVQCEVGDASVRVASDAPARWTASRSTVGCVRWPRRILLVFGPARPPDGLGSRSIPMEQSQYETSADASTKSGWLSGVR